MLGKIFKRNLGLEVCLHTIRLKNPRHVGCLERNSRLHGCVEKNNKKSWPFKGCLKKNVLKKFSSCGRLKKKTILKSHVHVFFVKVFKGS